MYAGTEYRVVAVIPPTFTMRSTALRPAVRRLAKAGSTLPLPCPHPAASTSYRAARYLSEGRGSDLSFRTLDTDDVSRRRAGLIAEARSIARSALRLCLRSSEVMRGGNRRDEVDFEEREKKERAVDPSNFSYAPPVDRENELRSRAEYYAEQAREEFVGESDCLDSDPWMGEADVGRYVQLIRTTEFRRKWVLDDYGFEDPYREKFNEARLETFENRAWGLIRDSIKARSTPAMSDGEKEEDIFTDDEDFFK